MLDIAGVQTAGEILCVLDTLDECEENGRETFIKSLNAFSSTMKDKTGRLKFIVTGRPYYHIEEGFSDRIIRLAGENETKPIQRDIDLVVEHRVPRIAQQLKLDSTTQNVLRTRLLKIRNRTYLWLHLILEDVIKRSLEVRTPKRMERLLENIPATLYEAYEHILDSSPDIKTARKLLSIVIAAVRPQALKEMNTALHLEEDHRSLEDIDLYPAATFTSCIRNTCGLFVTIYDSRVYLLHQTAKEFIVSRQGIMRSRNQIKDSHRKTWEHSIDLDIANLTMAKVCLSYLMLVEFEYCPLPPQQAESKESSINETSFISEAPEIVKETTLEEHEIDGTIHTSNTAGLPSIEFSENLYRDDIKSVLRYCEDHDFLNYASMYWVLHFQLAGVDDSLEHQWMQVCDTRSERFRTWFQLNYALSPPRYVRQRFDKYSMRFNSLAVASLFGHNTMVERLCKVCQVNSADINGGTALWWATASRQESTVELLLKKGAV